MQWSQNFETRTSSSTFVCQSTGKPQCDGNYDLLVTNISIDFNQSPNSSAILTAHSSLVEYLAQVIFGKNYPNRFIPFSIWYCPPHKILGGAYESSREHVFHKGSPFKFISISFIQRGDPYEKHVLWKIHKHLLIFCKYVPIPNRKCNKSGWDSYFQISLGLNTLPVSCVQRTAVIG